MTDKKKAVGIILHFAKELLFDSSDEEIDEHSKVESFSEEIVPAMDGRQFQWHFRLTIDAFEDLLYKLASVSDKHVATGHPELSLDKSAMVMIWYLANLESFRCVGNRFNISKSTCFSVLYRMCGMMLKINTNFNIISWPSRNRSETISNNFKTQYGLSGVIGAIDGCHIKIVAPKSDAVSYINRKGYHSVVLQGICYHKKLITDVFCGMPGSVHDVRVLKQSDIYQRITNRTVTFHNNTHIIGDLAYPLSEYLLVGFKDCGNLTRSQKNFNLCLSKTRAIIENAFALLKGRFRRLKFLETVKLEFISLIVITACILHNICILAGDTLVDVDIIEPIEEHDESTANIVPSSNAALRKRMDIVNSLPTLA